MDDYGLDNAEHFEHVELQRLLKTLRLPDDFNPYEVIRTPSEDRGVDTYAINFRISKHLMRSVDELHGTGKRFRNRSEVFRHYIAVGLMVERGLSEGPMAAELDPTIALIKFMNIQEQNKIVDEAIGLAEKGLPYASDQGKYNYVTELRQLRLNCLNKGDSMRVRVIDNLLRVYGSQP